MVSHYFFIVKQWLERSKKNQLLDAFNSVPIFEDIRECPVDTPECMTRCVFFIIVDMCARIGFWFQYPVQEIIKTTLPFQNLYHLVELPVTSFH